MALPQFFEQHQCQIANIAEDDAGEDDVYGRVCSGIADAEEKIVGQKHEDEQAVDDNVVFHDECFQS